VTEFLLMVPREGGNAGMVLFVQMLAFALIFYFLLIRPQKKEQDRHKQMLAAIKKGDEIVTGGGSSGRWWRPRRTGSPSRARAPGWWSSGPGSPGA
jgi:hypothetical protein